MKSLKAIYWAGMFFVFFLLVPANVSAQTYEGNVDRVDRDGIHGWLANPAYPNDSSFYEVWGDYTDEKGQKKSCYIGGYMTLVERTDVNAHLGVEGKHGFYLPATSCMLGRLVTLRVYGYDWYWDEWYEVQYASGHPGYSIIRADDDHRPTVTARLTTRRGTDKFDSFLGKYAQVTLLRMNDRNFLSHESLQNQSSGNCYVREGVFSCWEGYAEERKLPLGDYRLEVSANGMKVYSEPFRFNGVDLNLGDIILVPMSEMTLRQVIDLGRVKVLVIEVEHWEDTPIEVCGVVRGRGISTYDVVVPFGCHMTEKGKRSYSFQLDVSAKFPAGMWVSYKFTMQSVGNPWEPIGELWGDALIER